MKFIFDLFINHHHHQDNNKLILILNHKLLSLTSLDYMYTQIWHNICSKVLHSSDKCVIDILYNPTCTCTCMLLRFGVMFSDMIIPFKRTNAPKYVSPLPTTLTF